MNSTSRPEPVEGFGIEQVREWPASGATRAAIVVVHGIAEHSGRYERTGSLLSDAGFAVRSFDLFGFGASGGPRGDIADWKLYFDQIERHLDAMRSKQVPVVLLGHSMGGNLAAGYVISGRPSPTCWCSVRPPSQGVPAGSAPWPVWLPSWRPPSLFPNH